MPFQITFSQRQQILAQAILRSAGDDQIHICTPTIYLEAFVDTTDLTGHTIEWEQIGGSLVTLINADTLTPHFDAVDNTDKFFRVYVDRGTPLEQFDDVGIIKTPTSFAVSSFNENQPTIIDILDPQPVACDDISAFVDVTMPAPTSVSGEEFGSTVVVEITWSHPTPSRYQQHISHYHVVENSLIVDSLPDIPIATAGDGDGPPSETLQYDGIFATYRIDTFYNISGKEYVKESCEKDFTTLPQPLVKGYNDNTGDDMFNTSFHENQPHLDLVRFTFIDITDGNDPVNTAFHSNAPYINITRFGGSGIGS